MFRRIELINGMSADHYDNMIRSLQQNGEAIDKDLTRYWKTGLMGFGNETVTEAWGRCPARSDLLREIVVFISLKKGGGVTAVPLSPLANKPIRNTAFYASKRNQ